MVLFLTFSHILFVIAWMVGVFYLPRMIVHYKLALNAKQDIKRLTIMAAKLVKFSIIMGVLATLTGLMLAYYAYQFKAGWIHAKILTVFIIWGYFSFVAYFASNLAAKKVWGSALFWRIYNELALLLLLIVLYLVVYKPF